MNAPEKSAVSLPSASEYILDNFKPTDRVAILVLNRQLGETTQRITTAQKASSPEFQAWLRYKNANGADIYVGMNALQQHASTRTKDDIDIVNELTRLLPPPVWIATLEIHPDNVVIFGEADQAAPLLKVLDSSPLFRNSEFAMPVSRNGPNESFRIKIMRRKPQ